MPVTKFTPPKQPVKAERTNWRDQALSLRHREWGNSIQATDLNFVLVETDEMKPIVVINYVLHTSPKANEYTQSDIVYSRFYKANGHPLPYIRAIYWNSPEFSFRACRMPSALQNSVVGTTIPDDKWRDCTELEFVTRLYELRGKEMPVELYGRLATVKPTYPDQYGV